MIYLFMGILSFWYFYKKFDKPVFIESKKDTILNLLMVMAIILTWPVFIVAEIVLRIRGVK